MQSRTRLFLVIVAVCFFIALIISSLTTPQDDSPPTSTPILLFPSLPTRNHKNDDVTFPPSEEREDEDEEQGPSADLCQRKHEHLPLQTATAAVTFNPLQPYYGLSNQMISYSSALRYSMDERRALLFPEHNENALVPFHLIFNATLAFSILRSLSLLGPFSSSSSSPDPASLFWALRRKEVAEVQRIYGGGCTNDPNSNLLRLVPDSAFPFVSMNKKNMFLPNRDAYRSPASSAAVKGARVYMKRLHFKATTRYNFTRHHNFFGRVPWAALIDEGDAGDSSSSSSSSPLFHESFFLNALQPINSIERAWFSLARALRSAVAAPAQNERHKKRSVLNFIHSHVISVHLRIEQDASLLLDTLPTAEVVAEWLEKVISDFDKMRRRRQQLTVWICIGAWPSRAFEKQMEDHFPLNDNRTGGRSKVHVFWRNRLVRHAAAFSDFSALKNLPVAVGAQRAIHRLKASVTQDHYRSFVDLLFLSRSRAAILSDHSSLKFMVFARRCYGADVSSSDSKIRLKLEQLVPVWQRWWRPAGTADDETTIFTFSVNKMGQMSQKLREISCKDRARGWAGHKSWGT